MQQTKKTRTQTKRIRKEARRERMRKEQQENENQLKKEQISKERQCGENKILLKDILQIQNYKAIQQVAQNIIQQVDISSPEEAYPNSLKRSSEQVRIQISDPQFNPQLIQTIQRQIYGDQSKDDLIPQKCLSNNQMYLQQEQQENLQALFRRYQQNHKQSVSQTEQFYRIKQKYIKECRQSEHRQYCYEKAIERRNRKIQLLESQKSKQRSLALIDTINFNIFSTGNIEKAFAKKSLLKISYGQSSHRVLKQIIQIKNQQEFVECGFFIIFFLNLFILAYSTNPGFRLTFDFSFELFWLILFSKFAQNYLWTKIYSPATKITVPFLLQFSKILLLIVSFYRGINYIYNPSDKNFYTNYSGDYQGFFDRFYIIICGFLRSHLITGCIILLGYFFSGMEYYNLFYYTIDCLKKFKEYRFFDEGQYIKNQLTTQNVKIQKILVKQSLQQLGRIMSKKNSIQNYCTVCCQKLTNFDLSLYEEISLVNCGHLFHRKCITMWKEYKQSDDYPQCPNCREFITKIQQWGFDLN